MEYKSLDQIGREIVEAGNNNFIYENDSKKRAKVLKELEILYPIVEEKNQPMAIYIDDFGLPIINPTKPKSLEKVALICDNYVSFTLLSSLIKKAVKDIDIDTSKTHFSKVLDFFNKSVIKDGKVETMNSLLQEVENSRSFYIDYYENYMLEKPQRKSINNLKIDFIELRSLLKGYKNALENGSYFAFILDKQGPISNGTTLAINYLMGARSNLDYSVSVGTEENGWNHYRIGDGQPIEAMHDYKVISLQKRRL